MKQVKIVINDDPEALAKELTKLLHAGWEFQGRLITHVDNSIATQTPTTGYGFPGNRNITEHHIVYVQVMVR